MNHKTIKRPIRRCGRIPLSTRLIITPAEAQQGFRADSQTINVSLHGARICTDIPLETDMQVRVFQPWRNRIQLARVIWARGAGFREYGIELADVEDFWGIQFPPDRWHELETGISYGKSNPELTDLNLSASADATVVGGAEASGIVGPHTSVRDGIPDAKSQTDGFQSAVRQKGETPFLLEVPASGLEVVVNGLTMAGMPFRETTLFLPNESDQTRPYLWLRTPIRDGSRLRVMFPNGFMTTVRVRGTFRTQSPTKEGLVLVELPPDVYLSSDLDLLGS